MMAVSDTPKPSVSPFFDPGTSTNPENLALLHLRRDSILATVLSSDKDAVSNTRFGNYPHATLLDIPWGSQVRASKLAQDTQKQKLKKGKKRKANEVDGLEDGDDNGLMILGDAESGFAYVLPPTPELWTQSLPHRTQVVYTPDYSYVLHRIRARPGSVVIEAGAGSGSFTHAAARAVYNNNGLESSLVELNAVKQRKSKRRKQGKVFSFEYHKPRAEQLAVELKLHGLNDTVTVTHRDVYEDGFNLKRDDEADMVSPQATAIFLDLPAPWLALKHLTRSPKPESSRPDSAPTTDSVPSIDQQQSAPFISPISAKDTVHLCTFSPCIEQVTRTVSTLRQLGWTDIDMVELLHRRLDVRRARVGIAEEGARDGNPTPATVDEAVQRLRETKEAEEQGRKALKDREAQVQAETGLGVEEARAEVAKGDKVKQKGPGIKMRRLEALEKEREGRKSWKEGRIVCRTESELKGHTSYLVFAVLPREWTVEDDERCAKRIADDEAKLAEEKAEKERARRIAKEEHSKRLAESKEDSKQG